MQPSLKPPSPSDAVEATKAHSTAVGSYPSFPLLPAETVTYSCQIESVDEIYMQIGTYLFISHENTYLLITLSLPLTL